MSFNVTFYSFAKEVNSTKLPDTNGTTIPCVANDRVDIINPVISLNRGFGGANSPVNFNYCKIEAFGNRFYFIENWSWGDGLWSAHCSIDVLATYKTKIGQLSAYVVRSAHSHDGTISDALYPGRELFEFFTNVAQTPWVVAVGFGTIVVGIVGNGGTNFYQFKYLDFLQFVEDLLSNAYVETVVGAWGFRADSETKSIVDPLQYITLVKYIPLQATGTYTSQTINVGFGHVTAECIPINLDTTTNVLTTITGIPTHPWADARGEYLNHAPWTSYSLYAPPFGVVELDPSKFRGAIKLNYFIDWITGDVILHIIGLHLVNGSYEELMLMNVLKGQIGVDIQIGQIVARGMSTLSTIQHGANLVSQVMGGITGGGGTGAMMGNQRGIGGVSSVAGIAGSIVGGIASAASGVAGWVRDSIESKIPSANTFGTMGSFVELHQNIRIDTKCIYPMFENNEQRGRPLCKTMLISSLGADVPDSGGIYHSGYIMIADPDVSNIAATASERDMIVSYMTGGFFYA